MLEGFALVQFNKDLLDIECGRCQERYKRLKTWDSYLYCGNSVEYL